MNNKQRLRSKTTQCCYLDDNWMIAVEAECKVKGMASLKYACVHYFLYCIKNRTYMYNNLCFLHNHAKICLNINIIKILICLYLITLMI